MRFDAAAELRAFEKRRETAVRDAVVRALVDPTSEAWLLGAMLCDLPFREHSSTCEIAPCSFPLEVGTLSRCDDVETDDFTDYRHRAIFVAIRVLQARGVEVDPLDWVWAVSEEIRRVDRVGDKRVGDTVDIGFVMRLVQDLPALNCFGPEFLAKRLRDLANHRRLA